MRIRPILPVIGLLALAACKDEAPKRMEPGDRPPANTVPAPPIAPNTVPVNPATPAPGTPPAPH